MPISLVAGGPYLIQTIVSVDWNHDGSPDLVIGAESLSAVYQYFVLLNHGHGNFTNAPETPIPVSANTSLTPTAVYDLGGNGSYDIIHGTGAGLEVLAKDPYVGYSPQMELTTGLENEELPSRPRTSCSPT